jgi:hypothetical protein
VPTPGHRFVASITIAVTILGLTITATAVRGGSPKADRIVRRHVAAIGGDKLKSVQVIRASGVVQIRTFNVPFTLWKERPGLARLDVAIMGYDLVQAYDGKTAWWINPVAGAAKPEVMPADFAREMKLWADFEGPLVEYKKKRHKIKYLGEEKLETGEAYKLRVALPGGDEILAYIDQDTHMEVRRTHTQFFRGKAITVNTYFSDFAEAGGITTPRTIRGVGFGGEPFTMTLDTIDTEAQSDRSRFDMPAEHSSR